MQKHCDVPSPLYESVSMTSATFRYFSELSLISNDNWIDFWILTSNLLSVGIAVIQLCS